MALLFEGLSSLVCLMTRPLQLISISCQCGVRGFFIVVQTWIELMRAAFYVHLIIFWKLFVWTIAVLSLPMRACTALFRERMLETRMCRMKNELEYLLWERNELEGRLQSAVKERSTVEAMLMELEDEHDEAIVKIQQLEGQVQNLKEEIQRLKEVQGKTLWNYRGHQADGDIGYDIPDKDNLGTPSRISSYKKNTTSQDLWADEIVDVVKSGLKLYGHPQPPKTHLILSDPSLLAKQREVALSQTLFSAMLSLVVGIISWEAENPCVPLVVALFIVVGMSLMSVVRFFSIIHHKAASDAVALLCFNWFILGTLTYPTLPRVARVSAPLVSRLVERMFKWLISSS